MTIDTGTTHIIAFEGRAPQLSPSAWVAPGATVVGEVRLDDEASVWYGAVIRADCAPIVIGAGSNIQDNVSAHADEGFPLTVGTDVSVGHNAVLHGCTIGDTVLIGMGAVVLNGAEIGPQSLVAAGAMVLGGMTVPARSLVAGTPAKVRRELTDDEVDQLARNAAIYRSLSQRHRTAQPVT